MACFIVPLTQAIATTVYRKQIERRHTESAQAEGTARGISLSNMRVLEQMLWGGSLMLIIDHIINGELTWMFPFFTALQTEGGGAVMLREMLTVGVPMSVVVTAAWAVWCYLRQRRTAKA